MCYSKAGIPPTLCKNRGKKRRSILEKGGFLTEKEEKQRNIVFVRIKLKFISTIILQIQQNLHIINID
jgi:hypothetical protein